MKPTKASLPKKVLLLTIMTCLALVFGSTHQSLADRWVDDDLTVGASGCDGAITCGSIQYEINQASNETVWACPGTYTECINMKNGVDLKSTGGTPTISCTSGISTVKFYPDTASMTCDIDGFEIRHPSADGAGVFLDGNLQSVTATVSNCNIHDIYNSAGIGMDGEVYATIQDNTIYDCEGGGIGMGGLPGGSGALSSGSSVTIEGNEIGASGSDDNQEAGIFIMGPASGSATVTIGDGNAEGSNWIHFNGESGIRLEAITDLTIDNNTIENNTKAGILLIDVGASGVGNEAVVQNNTIQSNSKAGMNIGGLSYLIVGPNNTISSNSTGGIAFNMGDVDLAPGAESSGPVTITGNTNINENDFGGISIIDAITNTVTITENDIYSNSRGGIHIQNACTLIITENTVRNHIYGGIHTGGKLPQVDPGGFDGASGSANLTIGQNKIYGNGQNGFGGGIDVRHADGTIYNNLVYENHMGGIRFGDWIDEIVNNTVADNGNDNGDNRGGGIIYDDISAGDAVNDPPEGKLPDPATVLIRNNIMAFNETAGLRVGNMPTGVTLCPANPDRDDPNTGDKYRDYNLVYANNGTGAFDCNWSVSGTLVMSCANKQYGGCGSAFSPGPYPDLFYPNDMIADPEFKNRSDDNYELLGTSPAKGAGDDNSELGAYGGQNPITW